MVAPTRHSSNSSRATGRWFDEHRVTIFSLFVFLCAAALVGRLFYLQIIRHSYYADLATKRQEVHRELEPTRGTLYVREGERLYPLVTNREYYLVYAEPVHIKDATSTMQTLAPILELTPEEIIALTPRLAQDNDPYEPIKKKITKQQIEQISAAKLVGIGYIPETHRFYPDSNIGGHVFGFVTNTDEGREGHYGLEGYFNKELSGTPGSVSSFKDALGSLITIGDREVKKADDGDSLVLTLDRTLQYTACEKLKQYSDRWSADGATVIIMEPTGAILAMCSLPDFDPTNYSDTEDINTFNNPAIFTAFEPGSVFKAFTMAAGLDMGVISPNTTYTDEGEIKIDRFTIKNSDLKAHGVQTMTEVLQKSLNTGAIFAEQKVGKANYKKYLERFGFGEKTGIELDTESEGDISAVNKAGEIYGMTASYGQGVTATSLQVASAFSALANNGTLMKPYIVKEIIHADGTTELIQPKEVRQVISPKASALLSGMLTSVVEQSYDRKAKVPGYYFGGKSGTAQVPSPKGGYSEKTTHSFAGFGPVSNPKFVVYVKLDNPKGVRFSTESIVPMFGELAKFLVGYYQIPPDYTVTP